MTNVGYADITNLAEAYRHAGEAAKDAATRALHDVVNDITALAQQYAPARSGQLRGSISGRVDGLTGVVSASAPYAAYVELGTGTRGEFPTQMITIRPRNPGGALRWTGSDGKVHFAKVVHSPGMKAHPYLRPALADTLDKFTAALAVSVASSVLKGPNS